MPSTFESAIKLTADMIQRRDDIRRLLGDRYSSRVEEWQAALRSYCADEKLPLAEAALALAKKLDSRGYDPSILIAALVEECEAPHV